MKRLIFWSIALICLFGFAHTATADFTQARVCEEGTDQGSWRTELWRDDRPFFRQENFPDVGIWFPNSDFAPGVRECFQSATPHSGSVLLHSISPSPNVPPQPIPVLLVPGAIDNGKRAFTFLAQSLAKSGFHVYALTFAHPNGDNFQHAEHIANAITLLRSQHNTPHVDIVAHSMGGIASRIYLSNDPEGTPNWGRSSPRGALYSNAGTRYRDDVRRIVFLGTPQGGADTNFRWSNSNFTRINGTPLNSPITWDRYYPFGTAAPLNYDDLSSFGYFAQEDYFPGQAQVVARWDSQHPLPGSIAALGSLALQQDWYTTYEGGFGFYSLSQGIDAAIERGGFLIETIQNTGVDPNVEIFIGAGRSPIMSLDSGELFLDESQLASYGTAMRADWPRLRTQWFDSVMPWHPSWGDELEEIFQGRRFFAEISAPSDGVILYDSVTSTSGLSLRGAPITEIRNFDSINHVELTTAGPHTASIIADENHPKHDPFLALKYTNPENNVLGWVESVLWTEPTNPNPDAGNPDTDAGQPDTSEHPDTSDLDTLQDSTSTPDTTNLDTSQDDTSQDDTSNPDTAQPDTPTESDTSQNEPDTSQNEPNPSGTAADGCACTQVHSSNTPNPTTLLLGILLGFFAWRRRRT